MGSAYAFDRKQGHFIRSLIEKYNGAKRKFPLRAAMFISPLVLLVGKKLMSRNLDQEKLLKVRGIPNHKRFIVLISVSQGVESSRKLQAPPCRPPRGCVVAGPPDCRDG